jgi:hypothetical protein
MSGPRFRNFGTPASAIEPMTLGNMRANPRAVVPLTWSSGSQVHRLDLLDLIGDAKYNVVTCRELRRGNWQPKGHGGIVVGGASGVSMRPKFSMSSDYGAPAQRQWMSASRRGTGSSVGPKILLAAVVVVAGVIGISGIYPQVIDTQRVQDAPTHLPIMSLSAPTTKRSGVVAAISLPPRRAVTTGEATVSSPRPASEPSQLRTAVAAVEPPAETATPLDVAEIPDVQADVAKPAEKSRAAVAVKKAVVVRKKVVRVEYHHPEAHQQISQAVKVQGPNFDWHSGP